MAWTSNNPTKANIAKRIEAARAALVSAEELMAKNGMSRALTCVQHARGWSDEAARLNKLGK